MNRQKVIDEGFVLNSNEPIDSRFLMSKKQMRSVDDNIMPQVYGCWCTDDGKQYVYSKDTDYISELGRFREVTKEVSDALSSSMLGYGSTIDLLQSALLRLDSLENVVRGLTSKAAFEGTNFREINKTKVCDQPGFRHDFLPFHEVGAFVTEIVTSGYVDLRNTPVVPDIDGNPTITDPDQDRVKMLKYPGILPTFKINNTNAPIPFCKAMNLNEKYEYKIIIQRRSCSLIGIVEAKVIPQELDSMPSPSWEMVGKCIKYVGSSNENFTEGKFYTCQNNSGAYSWTETTEPAWKRSNSYMDNSVILSFEWNLPTNTSYGVIDTSDSYTISYRYDYVPYNEVVVDYPHPVYETRGRGFVNPITDQEDNVRTIIYCERDIPNSHYQNDTWMFTESESIYNNDYYAWYQMGLYNGNPKTGADGKAYVPTNDLNDAPQYIYMAHWNYSKFTGGSEFLTFGTSTGKTVTVEGRTYTYGGHKYTNGLIPPATLYDFSNYRPTSRFSYFLVPTVADHNTSIGSLEGIDILNATRFMINSPKAATYGDLSKLQVEGSAVDRALQGCINLRYAGDLGKWKVSLSSDKNQTFKAGVYNIFNNCLELGGISDAIGDWDVKNYQKTPSTGCGFYQAFQNTLNIGDSTIRTLGKWDVSKGTRFDNMFSYYTEDMIVLPDGSRNSIAQYHPQKYLIIKNPKTDFTFLENWNVISGWRFRRMLYGNPYLTKLGDLRGWQFNDSLLIADAYGFEEFLGYCSALDTFKMPSIPRGTNVEGIVKGCTSLANIEVNELNVEFISFEDCPLTKQSVLNLINAATDNVEIKLKASVYNSVANASEVRSAIEAKSSENIVVILSK